MMRVLFCTILFFAILESALAGYVPKAFKAKFDQSIQSMNGGAIKSEVLLKYETPGKFYMKVTGGDQDTTYVCNRKKVWMYTPPFMEGEKGTLNESNSSKYCYSKIFDKLGNGLKSNTEYSVKKLNGKAYLLTFSKSNAKALGYSKVELVFSKVSAEFETLKVLRLYPVSNNKPTTLTRKAYKKINKFYRGTFDFKTPPNTKINKI